ncbi:MAG TPA: ATP synthase subunit I [Burkholderiaceae bacterium]
MFRIVAWQALLTAAVAMGAWAFSGPRAAASAALGGAACVLPNAGFAVWLTVASRVARRSRRAHADGNPGAPLVALFVGEFVKVLASVGLLALTAVLYKGLVWLALIVTVGAVLLMQAAAVAWRRA